MAAINYNAVIASVAVLTFALGVLVYFNDTRKSRAERRRIQASLIDAWAENLDSEEHANGRRTIKFTLKVSNASAQTFRNVDVWWSLDGSTEVSQIHLATISPTVPPKFHERMAGGMQVPDKHSDIPNFLPGLVKVSVWFIDANGVRWHRYNDGRLTEEDNLRGEVKYTDL
jgi:hypothetical protein